MENKSLQISRIFSFVNRISLKHAGLLVGAMVLVETQGSVNAGPASTPMCLGAPSSSINVHDAIDTCSALIGCDNVKSVSESTAKGVCPKPGLVICNCSKK